MGVSFVRTYNAVFTQQERETDEENIAVCFRACGAVDSGAGGDGAELYCW